MAFAGGRGHERPSSLTQQVPQWGQNPAPQERGGARAGEKAAFKLLGEHPSASILPPGQDQNPSL